jgi:transcriptional regulator of acetoin/glycerol metabolism
VERAHIEQVLRTLEFNISAAAATLGISRTTLYKKLRDHGIRIGRGLVE